MLESREWVLVLILLYSINPIKQGFHVSTLHHRSRSETAFSFLYCMVVYYLKVCLIAMDSDVCVCVAVITGLAAGTWVGVRTTQTPQYYAHTHTHAYMHDAAFIYSVITNVHNQVK